MLPPMFSALILLIAVSAALIGVLWLPDAGTRTAGLASVGASLLLAGVAFQRLGREWPRPEPQREERWQLQPRNWRGGLGLLLLVAGLLLTLWGLWQVWTQPFHWGQVWRWLGGLTLILLGLALAGRIVRPNAAPAAAIPPETIGPRPSGYKLRALGLEEPPPARAPADIFQPRLPRWLEVILLLLILATALWFRVDGIASMPPGIFIDETNSALDALRILEGRSDSLFGVGWFETPNGFVYLQTLFIRLLGTTFLAVKVQSILPGFLTILALYFLARELFGVRPALFAAAFLAFNRWHFNMSRWGWNEVYPPLIQALALLFILRGARRRSLCDWALAGFLLGLGMYTYLAIRMAVIAIALYLLYRSLVDRGFLRRSLAGMAVFAAVYTLTFAPLAFTYLRDPFTLLNRTRQISIQHDIDMAGGDLQPLWQSIKSHVQMFHIVGDANPRHNLPFAPMLDPVTGAFFLLGLGWALWRWRDHRRGLLLIWIPVTLLGGILSRLAEAPQAYRVLAVTPAIALLAGDAYDLSLRALTAPARRYHLWRWLCAALALAGLLAATWLNYDFYFQRQARDQAVYIAFNPLENAITREVLAKRADHQLYLSPRFYYFAPLRFFAYRPTRFVGYQIGPWRYTPFPAQGGGLEDSGFHLADPALDLPLPDLGGDNALFLLDLHFEQVMGLFTTYYPGAQAQVIHDRMGAPLYLAVTIPGHEISALHLPNRADQAAEIRGLYIPASGEYRLTSPGSLLWDGHPLPPGPHFLGKGLHRLEVRDLPADLPAETPVLSWEAPAGVAAPDDYLFRLPPSGQGLSGRYYFGDAWAGEPFMQRLDPLLLTAWPDPEPIFGPFSVTWTGELLLPADGPYTVQFNADDGVRFWFDGQIVGESLTPDAFNQFSVPLGHLTAGPRPIRIDYFQRGGGKTLEFFWQPPGQPFMPVAPQYLRPGQ
ncbi:MAG: glycosyltransferase family 39 protein [Caldilineales bacterium]|nr:glycosyltransferase family 39 protein [Caldilineales bacterium]